ncbi:amidohydrolase family protein [Lacrimispora sp. 38-1]|uniref:amidohydrolase family protein n=1 Tax=Lacrimispora sp. 38-1 TaxID=3125778 RepID=UPI003CF9ECED
MILIKNAKVQSMEAADDKYTDILLKDGKIKKICKNISETDYDHNVKIIDAKGCLVTPGLVESHCHIGMAGPDGNHTNEIINPIQPGFRALDALDYASKDFEAALKTGVTTVITGPGSSNLMGGTFIAIKSAGDSIQERIISEEITMKMALGENPKLNYSKMGRSPSTRMGAAALIREMLYKTLEYKEKWIAFQNKKELQDCKTFQYDLHMHSLMRVFDGMRIKIHAHQADDILTGLRIAREFNLKVSIDHCTEGYKVFDEIKESGCKVILGPVIGGKGKAELSGKRLDAAAMFEEKKIPFGLATDFGVIPMEGLLMQACILVKHGLSREGAIKALTIHAADAVDLSHRIGSMEEGKDADIVIWNGDPLETMGEASIVIIDGKIRLMEGRVIS